MANPKRVTFHMFLRKSIAEVAVLCKDCKCEQMSICEMMEYEKSEQLEHGCKADAK